MLEDVSLTFPENTLTALVGPSGSGKSTIARLTGRFWDVEKGQITLGGVSLKDMATETLLSQISMVFQDVYLFHDTIENNIRMGKEEATREEIMEAAKKASCPLWRGKAGNRCQSVCEFPAYDGSVPYPEGVLTYRCAATESGYDI